MKTPEYLAKKLRPLMRERVDSWRALKAIADPETCRLIDEQIMATAKQVFGDLDHQVLLTLPSKDSIAGPINLGTVIYGRERWEAGIHPSEVMQSVAVFGRSGSGKTNLVLHLLRQLDSLGIPFIHFDTKRNVRDALPLFRNPVSVYTPGRSLVPFNFNPFVPPASLEPKAYASLLIDVIASAYALGEGCQRILQKVLAPLLERGETPTLADVIRQVEALSATGRQSAWKVSTLRALESIAFTGVLGEGNGPNSLPHRSVPRHMVLELDALGVSARKFLVPLVCLHVFQARLTTPEREKLGLVVCLEEAHAYLSRQSRAGRESLVETLLRQWRELGVGTILTDQHISRVSPVVLGNACVTMVFNSKDPADVARAAAMAALHEEEKRCFTYLPVGQALVKLQERHRSAFLVRVPLVRVEKGSVTDDRLLRVAQAGSNTRSVLTDSAGSWADVGASGEAGRIRTADEPLSANELELIHDVLSHPQSGVGERYVRLGWSGARGHAVAQGLVERRWLEEQVVPLGRSRLRSLRVSPHGLGELGIPAARGARPTREGLAHAYWKREYARRFRTDGYGVQIEAPRVGGHVDVLATRGDERIGIEIEAGRARDCVAHVKNGLRERWDRIVVVGLGRTVCDRVCRQLARRGLIGLPQLTIEDPLAVRS